MKESVHVWILSALACSYLGCTVAGRETPSNTIAHVSDRLLSLAKLSACHYNRNLLYLNLLPS